MGRHRLQAEAADRFRRPIALDYDENPAGQEGRRAMGRLTYSALASLEGYIEDAHGRFD